MLNQTKIFHLLKSFHIIMYLTSSLEEASLYDAAFTSLTITPCLTELSIEWERTRCLAQRTNKSNRTLLKYNFKNIESH